MGAWVVNNKALGENLRLYDWFINIFNYNIKYIIYKNMSLTKLEILEQRIFSEKYPEQIQRALGDFNYAINNLVNHFGVLSIPREFSWLNKTQEKNVYTYQYLSLEKAIEDKKQAFYKSQDIERSGVDLLRFSWKESARKAWLLKRRNMRFYNLQFLFSSSDDYIALKDDNISEVDENKLLDFIIYNLDKIPDSLLLGLEFVGEDYKSLVDERKTKDKKLDRLLIDIQLLEKKIKAVALLKDSVKNWKELKKSKIKGTTRVMVVDSLDQNDWKIILTQTPEVYKKTDKEINRNKTVSVFDDIYIFARSQRYTLNSIEEKQQTLVEIKQKVEELIMGYTNRYGHNREKLANDIVYIQAKLWPYDWYYERKIKNNRFPKIKFTNPSSDSNVFIWIKNDLSESLTKLSTQKWQILSQVEIIEESIREHRSKCRSFNNIFFEILERLNNLGLEEIIKSEDENVKKEFFETYYWIFASVRKLIDDFLAPPKSSISKPFKVYYDRLSNCKYKINKSIEQKDVVWVLRQIFIIFLESKLKRFEFFIKQIENDYKLNNIENPDFYKVFKERLEKFRWNLAEKTIFPNINIRWKLWSRYIEAEKQIDFLLDRLDKGEELFD